MDKLKPMEFEILKMCSVPRSFKWLNENVLKGPRLLSSYLKRLQRRGCLARDVKSREYKTTEMGQEQMLERESWSTLRLLPASCWRSRRPVRNLRASCTSMRLTPLRVHLEQGQALDRIFGFEGKPPEKAL